MEQQLAQGLAEGGATGSRLDHSRRPAGSKPTGRQPLAKELELVDLPQPSMPSSTRNRPLAGRGVSGDHAGTGR